MKKSNNDESLEHRGSHIKVDNSEEPIPSRYSEGSEETPLVESNKVKVYKRRWLMLTIFSLNTAMNGCLFMTIGPINSIVQKYYGVGSVSIEWLSNMCVLSYIFLALPATYFMARWGIRPLLTLAGACNFLACILHYAGYGKTRFYLVLVGQVFTSIAYSTLMQMPGKLSSLWFPETERATATAIGVVMNMVGVANGFVQPTQMVKPATDDNSVERDLKTFYVSQMVTSGVILMITFLYREQPPTPSSLPSDQEETQPSMSFIESFRFLFKSKYFLFLSQSYAIYFALFVTIFVLVNPLITSKFPTGVQDDIGWMGFWNNMVAVVAFVVIGRLLDRYKKYRLVAVLLNVSSLLLWLTFVLVLQYTSSFKALYALYLALGATFVPFFAAGIETAAEMTYPVSEETSSSVLLVLGNVYTFIMIYGFGELVAAGFVSAAGFTMVGLYVVSSVLAALSKTELKRSNAQRGNCP